MLIITREVEIHEMAVRVKKPKAVAERITSKVASGTCIIDGCDKKAVARGLCFRCRKAAESAITSGKVTERQLIEAGMILESRRAGRPARSAFANALVGLTC